MSISPLHSQLPTFDVSVTDSAAAGTREPSLRRRLIIGDAIAALATFAIPSLIDGRLAHIGLHPSVASVAGAIAAMTGAVFITLMAMATQRLYLSRVSSMRTVEIARVGRVAFFLGFVALIGGRLLGEPHVARYPALVAVCAFFFLNTWRMIFRVWLNNARRSGHYTRPVILVGANEDAHNMYTLMKTHPELGYRIIGVTGRGADFEHQDFGDTPFLGETIHLEHILRVTQVKGALVAGGALHRKSLNKAVRLLLDNEVHVHMSTGINGIDQRRLRSQSFAYEPMVYVERCDLDGWQLAVKRVMDVSVASFVLVLSAPLWLMSALIVKMYDRGPIFFKQERVGRHGQTFHMLKLRSMVINAEDKLSELEDQNLRQGPLFKLARDPRVTPIGRFLRATSIDELPQLLNVIRGDMSLVGPRPALPKEVEQFDDALHARHNVLPGITGLWQVEGRDNPDFSLYQRFDIFYVENWSVALDISILVGTVRVVLVRAVAAFKREAKRHIPAESVHGGTGNIVLD